MSPSPFPSADAPPSHLLRPLLVLGLLASPAFADLGFTELEVEFDAFPTPGSHEIQISYPTSDPAILDSLTAFVWVRPGGSDCPPNGCPIDDLELGGWHFYGTLDDPESIPYSFGEGSVGFEFSFFAIVIAPPPPAGETTIVGYTNIFDIRFSPSIGEPGEYPVVFVTQTPKANAYTGVTEPVGNSWYMQSLNPRGGDLWIRYADGTLRNLTQAAGYGNSGFQGANSIAVRDPIVHWDANEILFSMVHGAIETWCPEPNCERFPWQIYTMRNFGQGQTPIITRVPGQPSQYSNTSPVYTPDDAIVFASDKPRDGFEHHYPLLDEYELEPTNGGFYRLESNGDLRRLDDAPSGVNWASVDSYGRLVFTRWDHLERDSTNVPGSTFIGLQYPNESATSESSAVSSYDQDIFPEASTTQAWDWDPSGYWDVIYEMEHFFPWMMNPDGTDLETLNHVGRHELIGYFQAVSGEFEGLSPHHSSDVPPGMNPIDHVFQLSESPLEPGTFLAVNGPTFGSHSSGQIIEIDARPYLSPLEMSVRDITHSSTAVTTDDPSSNHSGLYRDPVRLTDGSILAAWTANTEYASNIGSDSHPLSKFDFRIVRINESTGNSTPGAYQFPVISKSVSQLKQVQGVGTTMYYDGPLWQLSPREVRPRPRPPVLASELQSPEAAVFADVGVNVQQFKNWMAQRDLALIVTRDVTTRDKDDLQQVYNLKVKGTNHQTTGSNDQVYAVDSLQIFQGDRTRGYAGSEGRRIHPTPLHDSTAMQFNLPHDGPEGSVPIGPDGSQAAFVPAGRALTWQLTNDELPIVRERYWLTMQAGEIRSCTSCHGLNEVDQAGNPEPTNQPDQLRALLNRWKNLTGN